MDYPDYPTPLKAIRVGQRFLMLNYVNLFMRIDLGTDIKHASTVTEDVYAPVLNLETGKVSLQAIDKPCRIWGG